MARVFVRNPLWAIVGFFGTILVVIVACFLILATVASRKTVQVRRGWEASFGSYAEVMQRYPATEANAAALELERLTAPLGIDTATRSYEGRVRPMTEQIAAFKLIKRELPSYLNRQIEQPHRGLKPPPEKSLEYLDTHREQLDAVRRHLVLAEVPRWEMQLERMHGAPMPNLLGHIDLQKMLLAEVLVNSWSGDQQRALEGLEASFRFNASIRDSPVLNAQLISIADMNMLMGVLRQIDDPPAVWRERLFEHDDRESFITALQYEGWIWTHIEDSTTADGLSGLTEWLAKSVAGPYIRYCFADASERYRRRLDNLTGVKAICDYDLSAREANLEIPLPRWNVVGNFWRPNLGGILHRLGRLELNRELTAKVLDLDRARRGNGGAWPANLPVAEPSEACPRDNWSYEVTPEDAMIVALNRDVGFDDLRGAKLPTRFISE